MLARQASRVRARRSAQTALRSTLPHRSIHSGAQTSIPYTGVLSTGPNCRPAGLCNYRSSTLTIQRRTFLNGILPPVLVPPTVFVGLLLTLWTYKCIMTVLLQDRIIYMPYIPPFARAEKIEDYAAECKPVEWREERIGSLDGTRISLCVGLIPPEDRPKAVRGSHGDSKGRQNDVVICYFQGNGSSTPPRLRMLSNILKSLNSGSGSDGNARYIIVALSYRGYWKSSGRASQRGIEKDAQAMLNWVERAYCRLGADFHLVLWGQSIGAGIASMAAANYLNSHPSSGGMSNDGGGWPAIAGLIMETPFTSVKSMLLALYPQKWLPYQYLHPFLWNRWDSEAALRTIADISRVGNAPKVLLLPATRDEVVPAEEAHKLQRLCKELQLTHERTDVAGALHTEATTRREGQVAVAGFIQKIVGARQQ